MKNKIALGLVFFPFISILISWFTAFFGTFEGGQYALLILGVPFLTIGFSAAVAILIDEGTLKVGDE